ncbi:S-layer homology domain-containing protein [Bacillus sp. FJAT-26390]|uniref:S-layer homology domain-containing protein n=1 Tax=Bacillus sp. FJAT-26390 TaxID=1743142 RepID=UPI000807CCF3|nr:S-layer homology domain-containing protein [Bacillus sp. FJAT-26390]OBZ13602.1 hypothetical protein A7975_12330 [Bacillus sp. FJAT-26390]
MNELISRQDMAVMAHRAAGLANLKLAGSSATSFADQSDIADYAAKAVQDMQAAGILNDKAGNKFVPSGLATRAEAAKAIYSILSKIE